MLNDLRFSFRLLRREGRHTLSVCLTMALAIGATTLLFAVTYGVLMKPLPWPNADRLVLLNETRGGNPPRFGAFSNAAFHAWRDSPRTVEGLAAWSQRSATLTGSGDPERIRVVAASASLFQALGVTLLIGSPFTEADETAARGPVVVLSEHLWRQRFSADPGVLGRAVQLDGQAHTVVGVLADAAAFPDRTIRAWLPFRVPPVAGNSLSMFNAIAAVRPDSTPSQAAAEGTSRGLDVPDTAMTTTAIFGSNGAVGVTATPMQAAVTADVRLPLMVLLAAVGLLLLAATANVASLQLARATTRRREMAIRAALGAAGGRAMRQLLVESLMLGLTGGAAGLLLASLLHRGLPSLLPADFPRATDLAFDSRVVAFALLTSLVTSIVFGVLPALQVRRLDLAGALAEDGGGSAGPSRASGTARIRLAIMAGQVAVACVLLVGASLLGRSFVRMLNVDRGYDPAGVLAARLSMPAAYPPERRHLLLVNILERLRGTPELVNAAFTSEMPLNAGGSTVGFNMRGPEGPVAVQASPRVVSPELIPTLALRIASGRGFTPSDTDTSPPVAIVNQAFARRYLRGSALGAEVPMGVGYMEAPPPATIVGVLGDVRYLSAADSTQPEIYYSFLQLRRRLTVPVVTLVLRTTGDPADLAPALRTAVAGIDGGLVPDAVSSLEARILTGLARPRLYALLVGGFALLALLVASVGLFGVLSYSIAQRRRELAVRSALGATRGDIMRLVFRQGSLVAAVGVVAGLAIAAALTRSMAALLYGVTAYDLTTFVGVPLLLFAVSALACALPARRAARQDPLRALRG
jgi:putative ABC transport system permease protein